MIGIICIIIYSFKKNKTILFEEYAYAFGTNHGYIIYFDGTIKKSEGMTKSIKIEEEELKQLIQLANNIKPDNYETKYSDIYGAHTAYAKIYSKKYGKYIELTSSSGNSNTYNLSEATNQILKLTNNLYSKYLNN